MFKKTYVKIKILQNWLVIALPCFFVVVNMELFELFKKKFFLNNEMMKISIGAFF